MTDIAGIHNWIDQITNKAIGSFFAPAEKDAALHRAQTQYFKEEYAKYALSEQLQDSLSPFKAFPSFQFLTSDTTGGLLVLPAEYQYLTGGHVISQNGDITEYNKIEVYSEDEISDRLRDQIKPPTVSNPIAMVAGKDVNNQTNLQFYPKTPVAGEIFYLKTPIAPHFDYSQTGRVITYLPGTSTQLLWMETELNEVIIRALEKLGVSIDDVELAQYAVGKSKGIN